jgi:hypothetical protein
VPLVLCRCVFLLAPYIRKECIVNLYFSSGRTYITWSSLHELPTHSTQAYYSVVRHSGQTVKKMKWTHPSTISVTGGHQPPFNSPNSFAELLHLSDDDIQASDSTPQATISSDQATQPHVHKPSPIYIQCYQLLRHGKIPRWNFGGRTILL